MTALDDALNTAAPVYDSPELYAEWEELPSSEAGAANLDSPRDLSEQITGEVTIYQSLDDALPDPVTMTPNNDASGSITAQLTGRIGIEAQSWGWREFPNVGSGTGTGFTTSHPSFDIQHGDYEVVMVSVGNTTTFLVDANAAPADPNGWKLLAHYVDNIDDIQCWVWGRHYFTGSLPFEGEFDTSGPVLSFTWISAAFWARSADGKVVRFQPGTVVGSAATTSTTSHSTPKFHLNRRGIALGFWAGRIAYGDWTPTGGATQIDDFAGSYTRNMISAASVDRESDVTLTATTAVAGGEVVRIGIPLEVDDRPFMDAVRYFSPFNKDSPIYGFERDTAELQFIFNVLGETGRIGTTIYSGQMADIGMRGGLAELSGVSQTRLRLDRSVSLPMVKGDRENASMDWLVTWLMARGGQYAGPGPGPNTIYWNPFYGSLHAHIESLYCYSNYIKYPGFIGLSYPQRVDGPFVAGMYAEQTATQTLEIRLDLRNLYQAADNDFHGGLYEDQLSAQSSSGRVSFWVRGDAWADNSAHMGGGSLDPFSYQLSSINGSLAVQADIQVYIDRVSRRPGIGMQSPVGAYSQYLTFPSGTAIPADGNWHFVGVAWDWANGMVKYKMDAFEGSSAVFSGAPDSALPSSDQTNRNAGGGNSNFFKIHVPISDLQLESGAAAYSSGWSRYYPTPAERNATYRPINQTLNGISQEVPIQTWETIAECARASLSAYRVDELDDFAFLPQSYFGESAQMTPSSIADTDLNASELDVKRDASKIRNVITVEFEEVRVASKYMTVLAYDSVIEIPKGISTVTFPLDQPLVEIHLAPEPKIQMTNLTTAQIAAPATIPTNAHYVSLNAAADGSGAVISEIAVTAAITHHSPLSVTVTFTNNSTAVAYLVNNGLDLPFMRILGYPLTATTAYTTARDQGSVAIRRERPLTVSMPWIQDRATAAVIAQKLLLTLSQPRPEVTVRVMGDPRRKPGQLVTVADSEGTQAEGTWRILSVTHNSNGPAYTQNLALVRVLPVMLWDGPDGWDNAVWGE